MQRRIRLGVALVAITLLGTIGVFDNRQAVSQTPATPPARLPSVISAAGKRVAVPAYIASNDLRGWEALLSRAASTAAVVINPRSGPVVYRDPLCEGVAPPSPGPTTGPNLTGLRVDDSYTPTEFVNDPPLVVGQPSYVPTVEAHFVRRAAALLKADVEVYGYVWINANGANGGCRRSIEIIRDEIESYRRTYNVKSVFLDDSSIECTTEAESLRQEIAHIVRSQGGKIIANPGSPTNTCTADDADIIVNFEGTPAEYAEKQGELAGNRSALRDANPAVQTWHIVYGVGADSLANVAQQTLRSGDLVYLTDDGLTARTCERGANPFDALWGMYPLIRPGTPECAGRIADSNTSWSAMVTALAGPAPAVATTTTTKIPSSTSSTGIVSTTRNSLPVTTIKPPSPTTTRRVKPPTTQRRSRSTTRKR